MPAAPRHSRNRIDILTATVLLVTASAALLLALKFDSASRAFPAVVSALLILVAVVTGAAAVAYPKPSERTHAGFATATAVCAVLIIWSIALSFGGGFTLPTFFMQLALLSICGVRRPWVLLTIATIVTLSAYLLFAIALDVPLPASRFPIP